MSNSMRSQGSTLINKTSGATIRLGLRQQLASWAAYFDRSAMALALLLGVVALALFWTPTDSDLWWHLRTGELILQSGVPHSDLFSFTADAKLWIAHSWLLEVVMYAIQSTAGYGSLVAFFAALTTLTYWLTYRITRRAGAGPGLAVALLAVRLLIDAPAWGVRTQTITNLFFTLTLALLLAYRQNCSGAAVAASNSADPRGRLAQWIGPDKRLWLVVPLLLLWANLHAGFTAGLILLALWLVGETVNTALGWRPALPLRPLLAVSVVSALATLINPYGVMLLLYPLFFLGGPGASTLGRYIQEWQPIDARSLQHAPFMVTLLALLAVGLLRPRRSDAESYSVAADTLAGSRLAALKKLPFSGDAVLLLSLGLFLIMAMQAMRLQAQWASVWALAMAVYLPQLWPALGAERLVPELPWRARLNLLVTAGTLLLLAFVLLGAPRAQLGPQPHEDSYPVAAVAYLEAHPEVNADPLYNDWTWGGYLIARRWPAHKDFIDGRADPFRGAVIDDYVGTLGAGYGWQNMFTKYGLRGALVPRGTPLAVVLADAPEWQQVCCDGGPALLFVRR